jgi:hypothetical protein
VGINPFGSIHIVPQSVSLVFEAKLWQRTVVRAFAEALDVLERERMGREKEMLSLEDLPLEDFHFLATSTEDFNEEDFNCLTRPLPATEDDDDEEFRIMFVDDSFVWEEERELSGVEGWETVSAGDSKDHEDEYASDFEDSYPSDSEFTFA